MTETTTNKPIVLITGVSGLIGSALARAFDGEYHVVGFDIVEPKNLDAEIDWIKTDLTSDEDVANSLRQVAERHGSRLASVLHLAAYYDFSGEPSPLYHELTVEGTRRLLTGLRALETEQFVFSSTLLAMKPSEQPLTEDEPVRGEWEYPQSKLDTEELIRSEHGEIPCVILRIAGVYTEDCRSLPISRQIQRIYERQLESRFFPGNLEHGQTFVHLQDLVECFRRVVERRKQLGAEELFLIGEPDVMSYGDLQNRLGELIHGHEWLTMQIPKSVAKAGAYAEEKLAAGEDEDEPFIKPWMIDLADDHYAVDITRARQKIGWEPRHRLQDELEQMVERLKHDPGSWYEINGLTPAESQD